MSIELMMPSNHLILCCSLLFLPSFFPRIGVFSHELALHIKGPKYWSFSFSISSWGSHLSSFSTFPIYFKCWMTIEWSMLSSLATSHVVLRGSASMIALSWLLFTLDGQSQHSSSSRLLTPLQNFLNHHCTICWLASPGPNGLLMLWIVPTALWPILNLN